MNELATKYNPADVEEKWYAYWLKNGLFKSKPDGREPYTVVIPPPNVTGILHMGHMLNNTIQDILVRRARMEGKNACWVPGTDHASIATEAKVVNKLAAQGIKKSDLSREEFLKYAWEWKEEHGGIILKQLQKLGASCDWDDPRCRQCPRRQSLCAAVPACNQSPGVHGAENHGNTAGSRTSAVSQLLFLLSDNSYNSLSRQQCRDFLLAFQRLYPQALFLYR